MHEPLHHIRLHELLMTASLASRRPPSTQPSRVLPRPDNIAAFIVLWLSLAALRRVKPHFSSTFSTRLPSCCRSCLARLYAASDFCGALMAAGEALRASLKFAYCRVPLLIISRAYLRRISAIPDGRY